MSLENSKWRPLGASLPGQPIPRVTLPIAMGEHASRTEKDMEEARARTSFNPVKIEEVLRDGFINNSTRKKVLNTLQKDAVFANFKKRSLHLSREQKMDYTRICMRRLLQIAEREEWSKDATTEAATALDMASPLTSHGLTFVPVIRGQGTDEQIERWADKGDTHQHLGCYLQTELGHGTNVQALETTATYDATMESFDLHSPTLTSTKWWVGGSGTTVTHAVAVAQLQIEGKKYGPHLFYLQLRSLKTGELLPGLVAGDIGPKTYGAIGGLDNGWVRFNHVKLPRFNMLSRFSQVTKEGKYIRSPSDKLSYGGMIYIRSQMIDKTGWILSRVVTIAIRYLTVRRQFRDPNSKDEKEAERSVITYPSVNRRLIPILAKSYAYIIAGRRMRSVYAELATQLTKGDTTLLADVHIASSSLKAYCTKQHVEGIEEARQALGGHGFSAYAGFTSIFPDNVPSVTYEGDNYVLAQQVGRAMLKGAAELDKDQNAKVTNITTFLRALKTKEALPFQPPSSPNDWYRPIVYSAALQLRAARRVADLVAESRKGKTIADLSWDCVEVARSHAEVVINTWFTEGVKEDEKRYGAKETAVLQKIVCLHALVSIQRDLTPLILSMEDGRELADHPAGTAILTSKSVGHLETAIRDLVEDILPQAIGLTDAFGWSDWELSSTLGRKDGRVYESLMAEAEGNPLNHPKLSEQDDFEHLGRYAYGSENVGRYLSDSWQRLVKPLLQDAAQRSTPRPESKL